MRDLIFVLILLFCAIPCRADMADTYMRNMAFHCPIDEGGGTTAKDRVSGVSGALTHSPVWTNGFQGRALLFNNAGNPYIAHGDTSSYPKLPSGSQPYTIGFWGWHPQPADGNGKLIFRYGQGSGSQKVQLLVTDNAYGSGRLSMAHYSNDFNSSLAFATSTWCFVVYTSDGGSNPVETFYIFYNGKRQGKESKQISTLNIATAGLIETGGTVESGSGYFRGKLKGIFVVARCMTPGEIDNLYYTQARFKK